MKRTPGSSVKGVHYATSPLLASKTPPWRSRLAVVMLAAGSLVLLGRAVQVQWVDADFYVAEGEKRYAATQKLPAMRGRILDRQGTPLAVSVPTHTVAASPKAFAADHAQRKALAAELGITLAELAARTSGDGEYAPLKRQVDTEVWHRIKAMRIPGVHDEPDYRRRYPEGAAAAHLVGFANIEEVGQEGIELAFERELRGANGSRRVVRDRLGRHVEDLGVQDEPSHGRDVQLSIDAKIQSFAWQRLGEAIERHQASAGSVVVLDARSGEVLALANLPSYDVNQRRSLSGEQLRNRALTDIFEPGSTMKPFIAAWALETGRVRPQTQIDTSPGTMYVGRYPVRDHKPYGVLTVAEVIQKSSNVGTVKLAMQMPPQEMWELYAQIGMGQRPQIEFPGVVSGKLRPWKTWRPIEQATMSFGYGVSVSLLQLARAYTVFARDGELIPLTLLRREEPARGVRVLSPQTTRQVREMLRAATGPEGTAPKAQTIGYSVGGKTGTAVKQTGRQYTKGRYRSWFVGIAPISDPRIVVAVMVDEPTRDGFYGGDVAAPVFSQVVQQTLRVLDVPTDLEVQPQIVVKPEAAVMESF
ncbi:MAG: peptidoglycan D,D-transpeptidase FtsI family protein [Rubrivivax sp.]